MESFEQLKQYSESKVKLTVTKKRQLIDAVAKHLNENSPKNKEQIVTVLTSTAVVSSGGKPVLLAIIRCFECLFRTSN